MCNPKSGEKYIPMDITDRSIKMPLSVPISPSERTTNKSKIL